MRYRKLDINGDYTFGQSQTNFYRDDHGVVAQAVTTRLKLWLSEWFLDINEGMPWVQGALGKRDKATADSTIREHISNTQGVLSILGYNSVLNADDRKLSLSVEIDTIYGKIMLNEVL